MPEFTGNSSEMLHAGENSVTEGYIVDSCREQHRHSVNDNLKDVV